jgi:hypothetical protein
MIVLPTALAIGLLSGVLMLEWVNNLKSIQGTNVDKNNPWSGISTVFSGIFLTPAYLSIILGSLVLITTLVLTVYGYVTLRMDTPPDQEVSVSDVWRLVRQRFLGTVLALIGLGVGMMVVSMAATMVGGVLSALLISGGGGNGVMMGFVGVIMVFLIFGATTYISITLSLFLIIWVRERLGFFATIGRSFRLIWGKWWSTFGLLIVMLIICMVILIAVMLLTSLISSPFALATNSPMSGAARVGFVVANLLSSLSSLIIYPLLLMALAFQYFNLVERKEGESLHLLVDAIGQPTPDVAPQALRPDDEGEY